MPGRARRRFGQILVFCARMTRPAILSACINLGSAMPIVAVYKFRANFRVADPLTAPANESTPATQAGFRPSDGSR